MAHFKESYFQLLILVIFCVCGTLTFCWVEWLTHRDAIIAAPTEADSKHVERVSSHIDYINHRHT